MQSRQKAVGAAFKPTASAEKLPQRRHSASADTYRVSYDMMAVQGMKVNPDQRYLSLELPSVSNPTKPARVRRAASTQLPSDYLTPQEVERRTGFHAQTVRNWLRTEGIGKKVGGRLWIHHHSLIVFLRKHYPHSLTEAGELPENDPTSVESS